jgi:tellurite resistance protein
MLQKYKPTKDQAKEFLKNEADFIKHMNRALVYDCCEMAACDGSFTSKERQLVEKIAKYIEVDKDVSDKIIKMFDEENESRKKLVTLLFPNGVDTTIQTASDERSKTVGRAS